MQVTKEEVRPRVLQMKIEVEAERVNKALDKAWSRAAQRVQVPGFRKGKAPRVLVEQYLNEEAIKEHAKEDFVRDIVGEVLEEHDIQEMYDLPMLEGVEFEADNPATITVSIPLKPEVRLGDYKGISAERKILAITDEMVEKELENLRERHAKIESAEPGEIKTGDMVRINLEIHLDGKPLPGESRETVVEVGKNIPSVDEALIGSKPGDDVQAEIVYGEDDPDKALAGKTASARMKVIERVKRVLPELNDDFIKEVSEFETIEEMKADIRSRFEKIAADTADHNLRDFLIDEVVSRSEVSFPDTMVQHEVSHDLEFLEKQLEKSKLKMDDYLAHENKDMTQLVSELEERAQKRIKSGLVLRELIKAENIEVTEEDVEQELLNMAETYHVPVESIRARFESKEQRSDLENSLLQRKIADFLVSNANIKEVIE